MVPNPSGEEPEESPGKDRQYLATGFQDVDGSGAAGEYLQCLDLISGIPYFRDVKEDIIRIIVTRSLEHVLDAGCGAGNDLVSLASQLPGSCHIVGLDASKSFLLMAAVRISGCRNQCSLVRGDVLDIPLGNRVFDACRIDRVLQHIHNPARAASEIFRILVPGGTLVAFDNDWNTFRIRLDNEDISRRLTCFWRDSLASGRIGRELPLLLHQCGFIDIQWEARTLVLTDLPVASQIFNIPVLLDRSLVAMALTPAETAAVRQELAQRAEEGTFSSGYTGYLVQGKRP